MRSVKPALVLALCALGVAFAVGAGGGKSGQSESERARQLLLKTLERTFPQNVVAIILQRSPGDGTMQRIQVQISKDGKMRQTVLAPLSVEGVETIDNGRQTSTYLPDEKLLLIQESPQLLPNDSAKRIALTVRNYDLKLGNSTNIAGQKAALVIATPRTREMETRRYYIDERTGFLLQVETVEPGESPKLAFRAQAVTYPSSIPSAVFEIRTDSNNGRRIIYRRRTGLYEIPKNDVGLGFTPVLPRDLPCGFQLQDAQINEGEQWRSVAVRITDGLVKGTVYQWSGRDTSVKIKTMPGTTVGEGGGLKLVVAADVPESVRRKILQAFIDAANRSGDDHPLMLGMLGALELSLRQISFSQSELTFRILLIADAKSLL